MLTRHQVRPAALIVLCALFLGGFGFHERVSAEEPVTTDAQRPDNTGELDALQFVRLTGLNKNFGEIVMDFAVKTQTVQRLMISNGSAAVSASLLNQANHVVQKHGAEWDANLASLYAEFFTEAEMYSLLHDRNASPYLAKLKQEHQAIGTRMQTRSWDLMQTAVVETITAVLQEYSDTASQ